MTDLSPHSPDQQAQRLAIALALIERERRVLGQIAAGVPLSVVLNDLLIAVEAQADHRMMTSVLFVSEDGQRLLHGSGPSLPVAYNEAVHGIELVKESALAAPPSREKPRFMRTISPMTLSGRIFAISRWGIICALAGPRQFVLRMA